jgi:hypothetical protein
MITKEQRQQAEALYLKMYNRTTKDDKIEFIDIYEKQRAFLYGHSKEVLEAYKTSQNILRFMMKFFLWPVIADFILMFWGFLEGMRTNNIFNGYFVFGCIFFILYCGVLFGILWYRCLKAEKKHKGNVIWLNY